MNSQRAFSLIELLVVVVIIAALASLLLPAVRIVRDQAARSACASNIRHLALATFAYMQDNDGCLMAGGSYNQASNGEWFSPAHKGVEQYLMDVVQTNSGKAFGFMRCPGNRTAGMWNYPFRCGMPADHPATLEKACLVARKFNAPGGMPVLWTDNAKLNGSGNYGDFNQSCNHKAFATGTTSGIPMGGNCSFSDGSVAWVPYRGDVTVPDVAFIINGGSIGGQLSLPNCTVSIRLDVSGNLSPQSNRWDNLIIGRVNRTYENDW